MDWSKPPVKADLKLELKKLEVPRYVDAVLPGVPGVDGKTHPLRLSDLDEYTLARLCDDFRDEIFRLAGKSQPPTSD
jgi:hypothetical protein